MSARIYSMPQDAYAKKEEVTIELISENYRRLAGAILHLFFDLLATWFRKRFSSLLFLSSEAWGFFQLLFKRTVPFQASFSKCSCLGVLATSSAF